MIRCKIIADIKLLYVLSIKETASVSPKNLYKEVETHFFNIKFMNNTFQQSKQQQ